MKIHGKDAEQKFNSVEKALTRLERKVKTGTTYGIPPIPISFYCNSFPEDLTVGRYIFPASGEIRSAVIRVEADKKPEKLIVIADLWREGSSDHRGFDVESQVQNFSLAFPVAEGERVTFRLNSRPEGLDAIWIGFLYYIKPEMADLRFLEESDEGTNSTD